MAYIFFEQIIKLISLINIRKCKFLLFHPSNNLLNIDSYKLFIRISVHISIQMRLTQFISKKGTIMWIHFPFFLNLFLISLSFPIKQFCQCPLQICRMLKILFIMRYRNQRFPDEYFLKISLWLWQIWFQNKPWFWWIWFQKSLWLCSGIVIFNNWQRFWRLYLDWVLLSFYLWQRGV